MKIKDSLAILFVGSVAALLLNGCVSTKPMSAAEFRQLQQNHTPITPIHANAKKASINLMTPTRAIGASLGGAIGGAISVAAENGNKIKLPAPGPLILSAFTQIVKKENKSIHFVTTKTFPGEESTAKSISYLHQQFGNKIILNIYVPVVLISYFPSAWKTYRVSFDSIGRLIDLKHEKLLWQAKCHYKGKNKEQAASLEKLEANNGKLLKQEIQQGTTYCAHQLANSFLMKK